MQQEGQVGQQLLRQHVPGRGGVYFPVDRQREFAGQTLDRDRGRRSVAVVDQRPGFERGFKVETLRHGRRVLVRAAGEQPPIP